MPKLTQSQLNQVRYISFTDFERRFERIGDFNDKVRFATRYLLTHQAASEADYSFAAAAHLIRLKIGDASVKLKEEHAKKNDSLADGRPDLVNPDAKDFNSDLDAEMFLGNPAEYLKAEAQKLVDELDQQEELSHAEEKIKRHCEILTSWDAKEINEGIFSFDEDSRMLDVRARMENKFGGRRELINAYNATKPGFFSRLFNNSSNAERNLDEVYNAFQNPNHVLYGDEDALDKAAVEYIQRRVPGWRPDDPFPELDNLGKSNSVDVARMKLSIAIHQSVKEQRAMENDFHAIVEACKEKEVPAEKEPEISEEQIKAYEEMAAMEKQSSFQSALNEDLVEEAVDHHVEESKKVSEVSQDNPSIKDCEEDKNEMNM